MYQYFSRKTETRFLKPFTLKQKTYNFYFYFKAFKENSVLNFQHTTKSKNTAREINLQNCLNLRVPFQYFSVIAVLEI